MDTTRLEAFSDGVFAIAITLLVVAIRLPDAGADLGAALVAMWPSYLAYAVSFFVLGAIWINHHGMFEYIVRVDGAFLLLNLFQLMAIAFIPFPTAVLAASIHTGDGQAVATAFYGSTLFAVGIFVNAMWWYAVGHDLLRPDVDRPQIRSINRHFMVGPLSYAVATLVGLVLPWLALATFVAINVFFLWPRSRPRA